MVRRVSNAAFVINGRRHDHFGKSPALPPEQVNVVLAEVSYK